jgi:hypothetical protein
MTYSYTVPGDTDKDTLRFLIQDTGPSQENDWMLTDEEIQWAYETWFPLYHSLYYVAATLADTISARFANEASYSADGVSVNLGPVGDQYRSLAMKLREQYSAQLVGTTVDAGGMSPDEPQLPGTKPFSFGKGMHDNVEAGPQEFGGVYPPDQTTYPAAVPPHEQIVEP